MFYQIYLTPQVNRMRLLLINVVCVSCLTSLRMIQDLVSQEIVKYQESI